MRETESSAAPQGCDALFLPDFCALRVVLVLVVVAELLALVLTLAEAPLNQQFWAHLARVSLFVQWSALIIAALLCRTRAWLCRHSIAFISGVVLAGVLLITLAVSELALALLRFAGEATPPARQLDFVLRNLAIATIASVVLLRFFYLHHQERVHYEARARARIEALQARIRPHFLFNSMNTIAALIRQRPQQAETAVEDLADLFRASLADAGRSVSLEEELELAERYLDIERLRLGERLRVQWDIETPLPLLRLPPLTLQPLLENAIYHGIERLPDGGLLRVSGACGDAHLILTIVNPVDAGPESPLREGQRMALANIEERLELAFSGRAWLHTRRDARVFMVELGLPLNGSAA